MRPVGHSEVRVTANDPLRAAVAPLIKGLSTEWGVRCGNGGSGACSPDDVQYPGGAFTVVWLDGGCG